MTASVQLAMFEPTGAELGALAVQHLGKSESLGRRADLMALRGFLAACRVVDRQAQEAQESLAVFEMTLQFEQLAGLT